jgi:uncharacterized NAD(P)/FAD-binding protein YdhS
MRKITIIGGGASGTLLALNLLKNEAAHLNINLVERRNRIGRGVAFGTTRESHLLNVPAGRMGAFADDVEHFHKWLSDTGREFAPSDFVPRVLYGEYLRTLINDAAESDGGRRLKLIDDEAVDLSVNENSAEVILGSGEILPSDRVVLAFGNFKPPHPSVPNVEFTRSERYFQDPWNSKLYETIEPDDEVFIIGTGLSMVDVVLHLHRHEHRGRIQAISTRGLLPAVHKLGFTYPSFESELKDKTRITDLLKTVRRHMKASAVSGSDWRAVIDSMRPVTQQIWTDLPLAEKRIFKQHLSRYWNIARHRMPPEAADVLDRMQSAGGLEILAGRLTDIRINENQNFEVEYTQIGERRTASARIVVNCIGSESNFAKIDSMLVRNLIGRRHIRTDRLTMGIDAEPDGRVIDRTENPSEVVFTLGTALKGILWESTAIPEIRTQARDLALKLLSD